MSAITSDWAPIETGAPATSSVKIGKACRREEEFRSALNNYIAGYVADQQKRRAIATGYVGSGARNSYFTVFRRALLSGRGRGDSSNTDAVWSSTASRSGDAR
jgi:hypothetical protein